MAGKVMTPEEQVTAVVRRLVKWSNARSTPGRMLQIKMDICTLEEMWGKYVRGELKPVEVREE